MSINMITAKSLAEAGVNLIIRKSGDFDSLKEIVDIVVKKEQSITISSKCIDANQAMELASIYGKALTIIVE